MVMGMREILFRGKRMDNGVWVDGYLVRHKSGKLVYIYQAKENWFDVEMVAPKTVGQFTGLTDKNGKKIFEGDILRAKVYETEIEDSEVWGKTKIRTGNKIDAVWTVEHKIFSSSCGYFVYGKDRRFNRLLTCNVIFNNECEIIGNIHDNPELIGGKGNA